MRVLSHPILTSSQSFSTLLNSFQRFSNLLASSQFFLPRRDSSHLFSLFFSSLLFSIVFNASQAFSPRLFSGVCHCSQLFSTLLDSSQLFSTLLLNFSQLVFHPLSTLFTSSLTSFHLLSTLPKSSRPFLNSSHVFHLASPVPKSVHPFSTFLSSSPLFATLFAILALFKFSCHVLSPLFTSSNLFSSPFTSFTSSQIVLKSSQLFSDFLVSSQPFLFKSGVENCANVRFPKLGVSSTALSCQKNRKYVRKSVARTCIIMHHICCFCLSKNVRKYIKIICLIMC